MKASLPESTATDRGDKVRGNWATLLLPLREDESIDYSLLEGELDYFIASRVNGIYSNGTAGEFYAQSEDEFEKVSALLAKKCQQAGMPFQIGASHMSPQISLDRVRRAKGLSPMAFQIILPDWFPPNMEEILAFMARMAAEAAPIPLILYNPPHAKRRLSPEEWLEVVRKVPQIVGIKVPGGDAAWYAAMQPVMAQISVFIPGHFLATGMAQGARGAYSNVACLQPRGAQWWYELCVSDPRAGLKFQERLLVFWNSQIAPLVTEERYPNAAVDKMVAVIGGWLPGLKTRMRWPYRSIDGARAAELGRAARRELPELWS